MMVTTNKGGRGKRASKNMPCVDTLVLGDVDILVYAFGLTKSWHLSKKTKVLFFESYTSLCKVLVQRKKVEDHPLGGKGYHLKKLVLMVWM